MFILPSSAAIDVSTLPPGHRLPTVFGLLAALAPGGFITVTSNHDPHALRSRIAERYPDTFGWKYLEEGPDVWRVRITRLEISGIAPLRPLSGHGPNLSS